MSEALSLIVQYNEPGEAGLFMVTFYFIIRTYFDLTLQQSENRICHLQPKYLVSHF